MFKRVIIFGAEGMLGWQVSHYLQQSNQINNAEILQVSRNQFDILTDDVNQCLSQLESSDHDLIVNCAGLTNRHLDKSEADFMRINAEFPKALGHYANVNGGRVIHVSTDCVFSGKSGNYSEEAVCDVSDLYGRSKHAGDAAEVISLRTSLIGIEMKHHYSLLSWIISNDEREILGYTNHFWNGITTLTFAKTIEQMMQGGLPENGLYHIHSPNTVSKYELLKTFIRVFGLKIDVIPTDVKQTVDRSLQSAKPLCASLQLPTIEQQLSDLLNYCNKYQIPWKSI